MIDFDLLRQTTEVAVGIPLVLFVKVTLVLALVLCTVIFTMMYIEHKVAYFLFTLVLSGAYTFFLFNFFELTKETKPSAEAITASEEAYDQVIEAVTDNYTVKVTSASESDCYSGLAKIFREVNDKFSSENDSEEARHYDRVRFLEEAVSPDYTTNPQLLLETSTGIVTCYSVQYDQTTGTATLRVGGKNVDAEAPQTLKKD